MSISSVPDKKLAIKSTSTGEQQFVVMRKAKQCDFMVVLTKPEDCFFVVVIPDHYVWVLSALSWGKESTIVWNSKTSYLTIMCSKEMLVVRVLQVSNNDAATCNQDVLF